jgi:HTH-type transcriptional regulator/antitoxin HigA
MTNHIQNEYIPDYVTPPGETLQDILDTISMTKAELADRIGRTPKFIIDIIKHSATITPTTAMDLEKALGTPASFWNNRERRYRESLAKQEERKRLSNYLGWLKEFPLNEMIKVGWIKRHKDQTDQTNELLRFFGVASPAQWEKLWCSPDAAYRKSKAFASKPQACSVWLRKGEIEAQVISCRSYNKDKFISALSEIRVLTRTAPAHFEQQAIKLCSESGVAVVFMQSIKGAPVYGATRWLTPEKAMIQLSVRGKWEDLLWFTFFHEAGHICTHGKKEIFVETDDRKDEKEKEADRFAANFLISHAAWKRFTSSSDFQSQTAAMSFAAQQEISPSIVVGRLQHEGHIPYTHLNGLRRRFEIKTGQ